jgi:hypothetical protein
VKDFAREYHNFIVEGGQDEEFDIKRKLHKSRSDAHSIELMERCRRPSMTTWGSP